MACCISAITRQQTKSPSSDIRQFIMEILKSKKMHKFRKSVKISLVKTCTVSFHCFKSCSQSTVSQKNHQGSHFLPFHLFNFLTFTFFKVFSSSFQSMFRGLISDIGGRSCCQSVLSNYTLYTSFCTISNIYQFSNSILQYQVSVTF